MQTETSAPATIRISYQLKGNCLWHLDCTNHFGGIMRPEKHEPTYSVLRCLHCGAGGKYPKGAVGERCVEAVPTIPVKDASTSNKEK